MTVLITLTIAGTDTGPFDLYSNADGYVSAFETGVSKAALQAGYSSSLVPNTATIIRVKSTGVCTNYIDIPLTGTTTTTTSSSTTTTTSSSTTTTTTTTFFCADCRNWEYSSTPAEGDVISYYSCADGSPQSLAVSGPGETGSFCNCDSIANPSAPGGTVLTQIGICLTTTTTTTGTPPPTTTTTTTLFSNLFFDGSTSACGYYITAIDVNGIAPTLTGGADVPFCTDGHSYSTGQLGASETLTLTVGSYALNGCITVIDSASNSSQQNVTGNGNYIFTGLTINNTTAVQIILADNAC